MSVYMTEEEQVEVIKNWFKRHNNKITIFLSVVLLSIAGFKYWTWHSNKVNTQASIVYENMMAAFANHDAKNVQAFANTLAGEYKSTVYANVAKLVLAKQHVADKDYNKAIEELKFVQDNTNVSALKTIAAIRSARIYKEQKKYDQALAILETINNETYKPVVVEIKGDVMVAKGDYKLAAEIYRSAINDDKQKDIENVYLEMKLNQLVAIK